MSPDELVRLIVESVASHNVTQLRLGGAPHGIGPDWRKHGEKLLPEAATNAAKKLYSCAQKKRWADFLKNLARLATHIAGAIIRKSGGDTAAYVIDLILSQYGWRRHADDSGVLTRIADAVAKRDDLRREEHIIEILRTSYSRP